MNNSALKKYLPVVIWIVISFLPALVGSYFKPGDWYQELTKPEWTPPGWLFGPVWSILYLSMGIAASIVWNSKRSHRIDIPITVFIIQLVINALWSWIFFGKHTLLYSVIDITLLLIFIIITIFLFYKVNKKAGLILIPYLLWVSFATVLNFNIYLLNS